MDMSIIAAIDDNNGIGYNNQLLEHIPEDMKRFKELTTNNIVVMGRKTFESLPNKPLKNRVNIVITSKTINPFYKNTCQMNLEDFIKWYTINKTDISKRVFIIGGSSIYKQLLPYCDIIYLTKIHNTHKNVDTYFPEINEKEWIKILTYQNKYKNVLYDFWRYSRI